ncbi:MAG: hypothetical protein OEL53_12115 [Rhodospirillales bacterium]|nr:hypothetical protein [Rhodospirillales bacterium]
MDSEYEIELKRYELKQNRWQAQLAYVLNSDTAAVSIGLAALKTFIILNAGAIISIMAFVGQVWGGEGANLLINKIVASLPYFLMGAVSGAGSNGFAYFYQSIVTEVATLNLEEDSENDKRKKKLHALRHCFLWPMTATATSSLILFVFGAIKAISVLSN